MCGVDSLQSSPSACIFLEKSKDAGFPLSSLSDNEKKRKKKRGVDSL